MAKSESALRTRDIFAERAIHHSDFGLVSVFGFRISAFVNPGSISVTTL